MNSTVLWFGRPGFGVGGAGHRGCDRQHGDRVPVPTPHRVECVVGLFVSDLGQQPLDSVR